MEKFLRIFRLNALSVPEDRRAFELVQCLAPSTVHQLFALGNDLSGQNLEAIARILLDTYTLPQMESPVAMLHIKDLKLGNRTAIQLLAVLLDLAEQGNIKDKVFLMRAYFAALPDNIQLALGGNPADDMTVHALATKAGPLIHVLNRQRTTTSEPFLANVGASAYPVPRHGRNMRQESRPPFQRGRSQQRSQSRGRNQSSNRSQSRGPTTSTTTTTVPGGKFSGACFYCKKPGHRKADCHSRKRDEASGNYSGPPKYGSHTIGTIGNDRFKDMLVSVKLAKQDVPMLVDTGSCFSYVQFQQLSAAELKKVIQVKESQPTANGSQLKIVGRIQLVTTVLGEECALHFRVASNLHIPGILGLDACQQLSIVIDCNEMSVTLKPPEPAPACMFVDALSDTDREILRDCRASQDQVTTKKADLTAAQASTLEKMTQANDKVFSSPKRLFSKANMKPVVIRLKEDAIAPFIDYGGPQFNSEDLELVNDQINSWKRDGVIVPSTAENTTYLLVANNHKKKRVCPAFLKLNAATVFEPHPMPTLDTVRRTIKTASIFTIFDLRSAFTSIPLDRASQPLTSFVAPDGSRYQFTCTQWGLVNAATQFQRHIETVLAGLKGVFVYIDDILLFTDSVDEMLKLIQQVLERIQTAGLLINTEKSHMCLTSVPYLGNVLEAGHIRPDPARLTSLLSFTFPPTSMDLKSFLGAAGFVSAFIEDYGAIKGMLHPLLSSKNPYIPTKLQLEAFEELKRSIAKAARLHQYDPTQGLILQTDASTIGLGAVLFQLDEEGRRKILYYLSRSLHGAECKYSSQKLELLAVKWALKVLRSWTIGCADLTVITDHESLQTCMTAVQNNPVIQRWAALISEYRPKFVWREGKTNYMADFLSRHPLMLGDKDLPDGDAQEHSRRIKDFEAAILNSRPSMSKNILAAIYPLKKPPPPPEPPLSPSWLDHRRLLQLQQDDPFCLEGIDACFGGPDSIYRFSKKVNRGLTFAFHEKTRLLIAIYGNGRQVIVAPASITKEILTHLHDGRGHFRLMKTLKLVQNEFFWPTLIADVKAHLNDCMKCALNARLTKPPVAPAGHIDGLSANELVSSDLMGPFPVTARGNCYVLTITCNFSKFTVSLPVTDTRAETIAQKFMSHWFGVFGAPRRLLTDNGTNYCSHIFEAMLQKIKTKHVYTSPYNPAGDGIAERLNRTLMSTLRKISETRTDWDLALPEACYAHNSTVSASTKETPFLLMTGREHPSLSGVTLESDVTPQEATQRARDLVLGKLKETLIKNALIKPPYAPGDVVLLSNPVIPAGPGEKRMHSKFSKQLLVSRVIAPNLLILADIPPTNKFYKVNMSRVQMAPLSCQSSDYKRSESPPSTDDVSVPPDSQSSVVADNDDDDPNTEPPQEANVPKRTLPSLTIPTKRKSSVKKINTEKQAASTANDVPPPVWTSRSGRIVKSKVAFDL